MSRLFISIGLLLILVGGVFWVMERAGARPGHLPGDIVAGRGNVRFYFPVVTCIILSVALSVLMWIIGAVRR